MEELSESGSEAPTPAILEAIAVLLRDEDRYVRHRAADAVVAMGRVAATPVILERIASLLGGQDSSVRRAVLRAVGNIGALAASPAIIKVIRQLLRSEVSEPRLVAAGTLAKIMADGVRFLEGPDGRWETRSIEDLSAWNPPGADIAWMSS